MNELIESIFENFTVNGVSIPVMFGYYHGHGEPYVTYILEHIDETFQADNALQYYVEHYDFDVYSKSSFYAIIESVKSNLQTNGFKWDPTRTSSDYYETDTGYYHRTISFSYIRKEN